MNFQEVLNAVTAGNSDYATAKKLGIQRQTFSNWRNGRRTPDDAMLDKFAKMTGMNPVKIYLAAYAERIENPDVAEQFRHLITH